MSKNHLSKVYSIVQPSTDVTLVPDSQDISGGLAFHSHSWYQRLVQGSSTRQTRYREYDNMDDDIEVARALDTIAGQMSELDSETGLPLRIVYDTPASKINSGTVLALKAALKYWCKIQELDRRLFFISRVKVKYGDCAFRRVDGDKYGTKKWIFVNPKNIVAAVVDSEDITKVKAWQVRTDIKKPNHSYAGVNVGGQEWTTEFVSASDMIVFSRCDDMEDIAPFGESILKPVYRTFKQLSLLEDSIIIYRISRAPERRIFNVDVGGMNPARRKSYLEQFKNEINQKKIPSNYGDKNQVDSIYNPHCLALDTKIPLLDGRNLELQQIMKEYESGKELWAYSCNPITGEFAPGIISWAGITKRGAETITLTFDNGETLTCTPDHKIPVQGKGFVPAGELTENDMLIPFNVREKKISSKKPHYEQIFCNKTKQWVFTHRAVNRFMSDVCGINNDFVYDSQFIHSVKDTVHHVDRNRYNNNPTNLVLMNNKDHVLMHSQQDMTHVWEGAKKYRERLESNEELKQARHEKLSTIVKSRIHDPNYKETLERIIKENLVFEEYDFYNQAIQFNESIFEYFVRTLVRLNYNITYTDFLNELNSDSVFMQKWADLNKENPLNVEFKNDQYKIDPTTFSKRSLDIILQHYGFNKWRDFRNFYITKHLQTLPFDVKATVDEENAHTLIRVLIDVCKQKSTHGLHIIEHFESDEKLKTEFLSLYNSCFNRGKQSTKVTYYSLNKVASLAGYANFKDMISSLSMHNHRVIKIERNSNQDVGTLTIDQDEKYHDYHTFAISSGIYVKNSVTEDYFFAVTPNGGGVKIDTLPGGQGLGDMSEVEYFLGKLYRGLRVPTSYMNVTPSTAQNPIFSDGRPGQAYVEELEFAKFCKREQNDMNPVFDREFKLFVQGIGMSVDPSIFHIEMMEPTNMALYKQQEADTAILNTLSSADTIGSFSKRFNMKRFGQLSEEQIRENEILKAQEIGINPDDPEYYKKIYGENEDEGFGPGGVDGGLGDLSGGDLSGEMFADDVDIEGLDTDTGDLADIDTEGDTEPTEEPT